MCAFDFLPVLFYVIICHAQIMIFTHYLFPAYGWFDLIHAVNGRKVVLLRCANEPDVGRDELLACSLIAANDRRPGDKSFRHHSAKGLIVLRRKEKSPGAGKQFRLPRTLYLS